MEIPKKSRLEIEKEIENILSGKDHTPRGQMLRNAARALRATMSKEQISKMFVDEYVKKYGALESGEISVEDLKKQSLKDIQKAKSGKVLG